ncbi:NAD(P)-dependent oxidoreductase [Kordiimonas sp. SCSIO 12610]|uniref:NAD(P)-dependent oxidoreductase n=1 Tax=Kordiimonas sp. SCSIO 12610 TaxID=2829597 RepID=UPI00210A58FE|nr:NAD(P)-dependent oxidoreductase [Kordiimonas sp. SCSIO 12610]UTW55414.1 NAD(P)-dependent oxidoreductase [Kordiimonas sp. SCSIO 12610]
MTEKMLQFVDVEQAMPEKRTAELRKQDFQEIYAQFDVHGAEVQASRCSQCGVPYCQIHCPLSNNIPDWLRLTAEGRLEEAYEISSATNNMPEICGRICPQDRLCEGNCVIEKDFSSVTIGSVEKYITDTAWENGWIKPIKPNHEHDQTIGIIGAGPAGLAAAEELRKQGFQIHVYDRYDRAGGLLVYGIPSFKLEKEVVVRRIDYLTESGIQFHLGFEVGRDATLQELRDKHDALLIATGVYKSRELKAPGVGLDNIEEALDYLTVSNRQDLDDTLDDEMVKKYNAADKDVVVIGGGDTAMDCVRTAVRQGAKSVKCLYRRDRDNMPGSAREVQNAEEEGVEFVWLSGPEAFLGAGTLTGVRAYQMKLGAPDITGRQAPEPIPNSSFDLPCDLAIMALGFEPEDLPTMFDAPELRITRWGTVTVDHSTMMTNLPGVFAAGDIVRGASLVVWAIRDGRDAAEAIAQYLEVKANKNKAA